MNTDTSQKEQKVKEIVNTLSIELDADFFLFNAEISNDTADQLIYRIRKITEKHKNIVLILTTLGGSPEPAFRIMRFLKRNYEKVIFYIFSFCKSAGTLMALGANDIVMSDFGEFGPLDVQIYKNDDLGRSSGLDIYSSLNVICDQAYYMYDQYFRKILYDSDEVITIKTAADIASSMAVGLLVPITAQIDPLRLGETNRVIRIAIDYGQRLSNNNPNPNIIDTIVKLTSGYHSHGFVIDYEEAKDLLSGVREPNKDEQLLEELLLPWVRVPLENDVMINQVNLIFGDNDSREDNKQVEETSHDDAELNTKPGESENSESSGENPQGTISSNIGNFEET